METLRFPSYVLKKGTKNTSLNVCILRNLTQGFPKVSIVILPYQNSKIELPFSIQTL